MIYSEEEFGELKYCMWKPADFSENKLYPLIIFTHGAGSRGNDLKAIKNNIIIELALPYAKDAIVVAPQCSSNTWFDHFNDLLDFIKQVKDFDYVDKNRVYGIGVSMGGYTMIAVMQSIPEIFAAGIICCGGGMYWNAERLKNIRLRLFHGEKDECVYPEESRRMYEKIIESGGKAELTVYPECDHNCWEKTFTGGENVMWLLKQEK